MCINTIHFLFGKYLQNLLPRGSKGAAKIFSLKESKRVSLSILWDEKRTICTRKTQEREKTEDERSIFINQKAPTKTADGFLFTTFHFHSQKIHHSSFQMQSCSWHHKWIKKKKLLFIHLCEHPFFRRGKKKRTMYHFVTKDAPNKQGTGKAMKQDQHWSPSPQREWNRDQCVKHAQTLPQREPVRQLFVFQKKIVDQLRLTSLLFN